MSHALPERNLYWFEILVSNTPVSFVPFLVCGFRAVADPRGWLTNAVERVLSLQAAKSCGLTLAAVGGSGDWPRFPGSTFSTVLRMSSVILFCCSYPWLRPVV